MGYFEEVPAHRTLIFGDHIFGDTSARFNKHLFKLGPQKNIQVKMRLDDKEWYWIRSMGSDNRC